MFYKNLSLILLVSFLTYSNAYSKTDLSYVNETKQNQDIYKEMNLLVDYKGQNTIIIGHKNPDTDTVCSSIAYAAMYNQIGIKATPMISGKINNETKFVLSFFDVKVPEILVDASNKNVVLVDHDVYAQDVLGMDRANIVGIIDHHALGDVISSSPLYVRILPIGATSTIVAIEYLERGIVIDKKTAGILLSAILSDTVNLSSATTTSIDKTIVEKLKQISGVEDINAFYEKLSDAATSYDDMTIEEIFNSDYKEFTMGKYKVGITQVNMKNATREELTKKLEDILPKMKKEKKVDLVFAMATDLENKKTELLYCGEDAFKILVKSFGSADGKHVWLDKIASRKKDIVPKLMEAINCSDK